MTPSVFLAERFDDRSLIESILSSFYIVDYGFIKTVNPDKTIDVTHAKQLKTLEGQNLPPTVTKKVEVLTIAGKGFSLNFDYAKGDKVLLLGFKDFVKKVDDVSSSTETKIYKHYTRDTLKAIPMCVFNDDAKVVINISNGTMKVEAQSKIELNGNTKQFVTWTELNTALTTFLVALNSHVHAASGTPPVTPMTLDISSAKTTTVVTGG